MNSRRIAIAKATIFALGSTFVNRTLNGACENVTQRPLFSDHSLTEEIHEAAIGMELPPGLYAASVFRYDTRMTYLYTFRVYQAEEIVDWDYELWGAGLYERVPVIKPITMVEPIRTIEPSDSEGECSCGG